MQHKLESFRPQLGTTMFQQGLGSMLDKSERIERLVTPLAQLAGQPEGAVTAIGSSKLPINCDISNFLVKLLLVPQQRTASICVPSNKASCTFSAHHAAF